MQFQARLYDPVQIIRILTIRQRIYLIILIHIVTISLRVRIRGSSIDPGQATALDIFIWKLEFSMSMKEMTGVDRVVMNGRIEFASRRRR